MEEGRRFRENDEPNVEEEAEADADADAALDA